MRFAGRRQTSRGERDAKLEQWAEPECLNIGVDHPAARIGDGDIGQTDSGDPRNGVGRRSRHPDLNNFGQIDGLDGGVPADPRRRGSKARSERCPDIGQPNALETRVGQVRDVRAHLGADGEQGAQMDGLAVDQRAVDIPGNGRTLMSRPQ